MQPWMVLVVVAGLGIGGFYYYLGSKVPRWIALSTLVVLVAFIPGDPGVQPNEVAYFLGKLFLVTSSVILGAFLAHQFMKRFPQ